MSDNLIGVFYTLLLIAGCFVLAFFASKRNPEIARKIVHIGVAHWYFIYINCFSKPVFALAGLAVFAVLNGILNVCGGLSVLLGQKSTHKNWGLVWYPISFFVLVIFYESGIGNRAALGCAMLGLGWGDGLAALVGGKFGKRPLAGQKTWLGFWTLFVTVSVICFVFSGNLTIALSAAVTASILEVLTPLGLDNFSVPLGIYAVTSVLHEHAEALNGMLFGLPCGLSLLMLALFFALVAFLSVRLKLLTVTGALAAFLLGLSVTCGAGFRGVLLLFSFFISSNLIGKIRCSLPASKEAVIPQKEAQRDHIQVAANGLAAAIAAFLWFCFLNRAALIAFCAALAEATSDTWAGEIGRFSKRPPISLKSGKRVARGISGGVSFLGFIGGFSGAAFIALLSVFLFFPEKPMHHILIVCVSGFAGCLLDSLLGAYWQALYFDPQSGRYSELPCTEEGSVIPLLSGYRWVDNDMVNFISNVASALLAGALWIVLT